MAPLHCDARGSRIECGQIEAKRASCQPNATRTGTQVLILYEYPFNERIRTLLRLEDLFERLDFFLVQEHPLQHHVALTTLFEVVDVAGRADLKSDLLKELDRQRQTLTALRANPQIDQDALDAVISELETASGNLTATHGKAGQLIADNEWLTSIRSRAIIPGGTCNSICRRILRGSIIRPSAAAPTSSNGPSPWYRCVTPR